MSKDKHLRILYAPAQPPDLEPNAPGAAAAREKMNRELAAMNFGFAKVEQLSGNVGYLDLRGFVGAELAGETATAAMSFLAHSDAVIIDLRQNGGGSPSMVQLITIKRATLVGETTGGGAHPVRPHFLADVHLLALIPFGRAVSPITGTNWEGTGVTPDLQVPADKALVAAHRDALKKLHDQAQDAERKQKFAWALQKVEALANPVTPSAEVLKSFAGSYGKLTLSYENGSLWFLWPGRKLRAVPMTADTFTLDDGRDVLRFRMETEASGKVTGLIELYDDGRTERSPRTGS
ncbi:hypothetical protein ACN28E_00270 [Archangium lansingense]|uniref:hypothetical protein n=1 Tax=Archangium lansingense TaxID=2995310 RepID=UPI003B775E6B